MKKNLLIIVALISLGFANCFAETTNGSDKSNYIQLLQDFMNLSRQTLKQTEPFNQIIDMIEEETNLDSLMNYATDSLGDQMYDMLSPFIAPEALEEINNQFQTGEVQQQLQESAKNLTNTFGLVHDMLDTMSDWVNNYYPEAQSEVNDFLDKLKQITTIDE